MLGQLVVIASVVAVGEPLGTHEDGPDNQQQYRALVEEYEQKRRDFVAAIRKASTPAEGEKAIDLVAKAGRAALERAAIDRRDIDLLIYAGVGRGWLEPSMAAVVQRELGLTSGTAFDVLDGASVVFGPAARPLPQLPMEADADGFLVARGDFSAPVGPGFWNRGDGA